MSTGIGIRQAVLPVRPPPPPADTCYMVEFSPDFPFRRRLAEPVAPPADNVEPLPPAPVAETPTAGQEEIEPSAPKRPLVERRKILRDKMTAPGLIQPDGFKGPPIKVSLIDVSVQGCRFSAPQSLEVGEKLQIRVEAGPFRWTTRMRVIHCTRNGNSSVIGCAFLRTELLRPWPTAA